MLADSAADVRGPVATITGPPADAGSGTSVTSSRTTVMSGWASTSAVTLSANRSRSTASAAPAGTRTSSATRITSEPSRRISSLRRPTALSSLSLRRELLQTSSARFPVR